MSRKYVPGVAKTAPPALDAIYLTQSYYRNRSVCRMWTATSMHKFPSSCQVCSITPTATLRCVQCGTIVEQVQIGRRCLVHKPYVILTFNSTS